MTRTLRTKGYMGQLLDGKKLADLANAIYAIQYNEAGVCTVDHLLLIELKEENVFGENKYAVICQEGVGWEQDSYGCLEIPTNIGQWSHYEGHVFLSIEVVKSCLTGEQLDVSDYVRTFGDRLDSNCYLWQSKMIPLSKKDKVKS